MINILSFAQLAVSFKNIKFPTKKKKIHIFFSDSTSSFMYKCERKRGEKLKISF